MKKEANIPQGDNGMDPVKIGSLLHELCTRHHVRPGQVVLLLPPSAVYTARIHLPQGRRFDDEVAKCMPEEVSALLVQREELSEGMVGVAAVRRERLEMYRKACTTAGMRIAAITTVPCVLAACAAREEKEDSPLLLIRAFPQEEPTITLFHQGWPIDEVLLLPDASSMEVAAHVRDLIAEYEGKGFLVVKRVIINGDGIPPATIEAALPPLLGNGGALEKGKEKQGRRIAPIFAEAGVFGGVCCATLRACATRLDLLRAQPLSPSLHMSSPG